MAVSTITADRLDSQLETEQTDCYRVILFNGAGAEVLLRRLNEAYALPEVRVPKFTRPAEQITSVLRNNWGIATVLLFSECVEGGQGQISYATLEVTKECPETLPGMEWFPVNEAAAHLLESGGGSALKSSNERVFQQCSAGSPPFSRLGWMRRLQEWVRTILGPCGIEILDFQQLNGGGAFSLVRFETTRKPVWFKAVGKPNLREFPLTLLLSELFRSYLPTILAADPVVNGWLMESAGEVTLRDMEREDSWLGAIRRLADLQIESIGRTGRLLDEGCRDLRIETLASMADPFFEAMASLMESQTKSPPPLLTRQELSDLASTIQEALRLLRDLGMPDTLGHSDFNPGNILVDDCRCVFTDWAEGHVGHPFLTFEYFLAHLRKCCPAVAIREDDLRKAYSQRWLPTTSTRSIDRALHLSPLIAVYAYAVSGGAWNDSERLRVPRVPAYMRSLTRIMNKEAYSLRQAEGFSLKRQGALLGHRNWEM
jgi:hypothetical protein